MIFNVFYISKKNEIFNILFFYYKKIVTVAILAQASGVILTSHCAYSAASAMNNSALLEWLNQVSGDLEAKMGLLTLFMLQIPLIFRQDNKSSEESYLDDLSSWHKKIGLNGICKKSPPGNDIDKTFVKLMDENYAQKKIIAELRQQFLKLMNEPKEAQLAEQTLEDLASLAKENNVLIKKVLSEKNKYYQKQEINHC